MTEQTQPTDAELLDAADDFRSQYKHGGTTFDEFDALGFARAVLAKWATPPALEALAAWNRRVAPATMLGEPVFAFRRKGLDDFCTCTEKRYAELSLKPKLFETRIFYTTPQPTQAQAGALLLPKSYHGSTLTSNSHDAGCRVSFSFSSVAEAEAWHEAIVDQHHGIKGGQS